MTWRFSMKNINSRIFPALSAAAPATKYTIIIRVRAAASASKRIFDTFDEPKARRYTRNTERNIFYVHSYARASRKYANEFRQFGVNSEWVALLNFASARLRRVVFHRNGLRRTQCARGFRAFWNRYKPNGNATFRGDGVLLCEEKSYNSNYKLIAAKTVFRRPETPC